MTAALIVLLPLGVSTYTLILAWSLWAANLAALVMVFCLIGVIIRRYGFVVAGAFIALINYIQALGNTETLKLWPSLGVGLALFVLLEAAYDWIVAIRVRIPWRSYKRRVYKILGTLGLSASSVFVFLTLGYNASLHLSFTPPLYLAILSVFAVVIGAAALFLYRIGFNSPSKPRAARKSKDDHRPPGPQQRV